MATRLPNGKFRVQIRKKGIAPIHGIFATEEEATAFEQAENARVAQGCALWTPQMTFAEARDAYLGSTLFSDKAPHSQATERTRLKPVIAALGKFSLENLENGQHLARYRDRRSKAISPRTKKKISADSVRLELAAAAAVFAWAKGNRVLTRNPADGITRPHGPDRARRFYEHEELNLLGAMFADDFPENLRQAARFITLQREIGCRPGELAALLRQDTDLENRASAFRDTKNGDTRTIPLTKPAMDILATQLVYGAAMDSNSPFVFTSLSRSGRMPVPYGYKTAVNLLREAGVVDLDFVAHAGRREFASNAFENGLSHADVMKLTGHRSYAAVEVYNQSKALHPDVRKRIDAESKMRRLAMLHALAEEFGIPRDAVDDFVRANQTTSIAADRDAPRATTGAPPKQRRSP